MFIIFGWGKPIQKYYGSLFKYHCSHCNNTGDWEFNKYSLWLTLFFIPIIPYETHYYLTCPTCEWGIELNGAEAKELINKYQLEQKRAKIESSFYVDENLLKK